MEVEGEVRKRSGSEDDNLTRSTLKVKAASENPVLGAADQNRPVFGGEQSNPRVSFRDAAMGSRDSDGKLGSLDSDEGLIHVSTLDGCPRISLSDRFKTHIRRKWERCLIVKLLGRSISYRVLYDKLHKIWNLKGEISLVDLGMGYFLLRFVSNENYLFAREEGSQLRALLDNKILGTRL